MKELIALLIALGLGALVGVSRRRGGQAARDELDQKRHQELEEQYHQKLEESQHAMDQANQAEQEALDEHRATASLDERIDAILGDGARLREEQERGGGS